MKFIYAFLAVALATPAVLRAQSLSSKEVSYDESQSINSFGLSAVISASSKSNLIHYRLSLNPKVTDESLLVCLGLRSGDIVQAKISLLKQDSVVSKTPLSAEYYADLTPELAKDATISFAQHTAKNEITIYQIRISEWPISVYDKKHNTKLMSLDVFRKATK